MPVSSIVIVRLLFIFWGAGTLQSVPPAANTHSQVQEVFLVDSLLRYQRSIVEYFTTQRASQEQLEKGKAPIKKIPTCTIKFCCLGFVDSDKPPTSVAAKTTLANSSLGPSTMSFEMNGVDIHSQLLERYAKLSSAGSYELLLYQRGRKQQGFHHLPPPHSPSRIKEIANASVVYIRPLQRDILDTEDSSIDNVVNPAQEVGVIIDHLIDCLVFNVLMSLLFVVSGLHLN